jgi:hypothetical protein
MNPFEVSVAWIIAITRIAHLGNLTQASLRSRVGQRITVIGYLNPRSGMIYGGDRWPQAAGI